MQDTQRTDIQDTLETTANQKLRLPCQILAKKGFLTARDLTSGVALLVYSSEFQLGVLFHLPSFDEAVHVEDQSFAKAAMAMILAEFQTLGVRRRDLTTYAIGGSAVDGKPEVTHVMVRRALWSHGLSLSASDLGGKQSRSIWMDVETGRIIIRTEPLKKKTVPSATEISVAS